MGIYTIKQVLQKAESKEYYEGLDYMARINSSMLQTGDMAAAITANLGKTQPVFPKLWLFKEIIGRIRGKLSIKIRFEVLEYSNLSYTLNEWNAFLDFWKMFTESLIGSLKLTL